MSTSCGEYLIQAVEAAGITHAFGIPGVHNLALYRGVAASGLTHITPRHEQGAAFMADGFARMSGRPALVLPITGAGVLNAATAIAQAYSDSVPMLVVATNNPLSTQDRGLGELHETRDQTMALRGILDDVYVIRKAADLPDVLRAALGRLRRGRPRPVYVELPIDIAEERLDARIEDALPADIAPGLDLASIARLRERLSHAERPLLLLGGGAAGASEGIWALAQATGALVVTSIAGKGVVADDAPCSLGARMGEPAAISLMERCDFALAIGTELSSTDRYCPLPDWRGNFARIDIDPAQLDRAPRPIIAVQGDARSAVDALRDGLPTRDAPAWYGDLAPVRQIDIDAWRAKSPTIVSALSALRDALPDDAVVVTDMTQIAYAGGTIFPARRPQGWLHPTGYGTLGYGMPAALGAQLGAPDTTVIALAGDYGFGFSGPELATAAANRIGVTTVVWNNRRLGQIQDDMDESGIPRTGVVVSPPDFDLFARAHGTTYTNMGSSNRSISAIVEEAHTSGTPALIEIAEPA